MPAGAAPENCYYDPVERTWVCDDGGGGPGDEDPATDYWTEWTLVGPCGGGGGAIGGGLVDIRTGLLMAMRYHYVDGEVVETQSQCIDLDGAETDAWDEIASAAAALPDPGWESNPDSTISKGLTGLETWIWSSHETQVGPIAATWAEPVTGIVFAVEGRGWTETITWDTGDGTYDAFAATYLDADGLGGTPDEPPVTHLYETTSARRRLLDRLPRLARPAVGGGVPSRRRRRRRHRLDRLGPRPLDAPGEFPATYEVVEVRSELAG